VKETMRIILSHSRTFEEAKEEKEKPARKAAAKKVEEKPAVSNVAAGTSLGDLDVLADLKAKMEQGE